MQGNSAAVGAALGRWHEVWRALCLLILLWVGLQPGALATPNAHLSFRHILPEEVAGLGYINDITQDRQGFLWFAGANGLGRFDGYQLTVYRHDSEDSNSLMHNYVNRIVVADSGHLWLATTEGLSRFDPKTDSFQHFLHAGARNDVRDLWLENESTLWLATRGGFFRLDWQADQYQQIELVAHDDELVSVSALVRDKAGYFWLGTRAHGVYQYQPETGALRNYLHQPDDPLSLSDNDVRAVATDRYDQVWFGTYGGGLVRFDRAHDQFVRYPNLYDEKNQTVWDFYHDREGRYWVGDGRSVNLFDPDSGEFTPFAYSEGDAASPGNFVVTAIYEDIAGDIWLGFFPSGVDRVDRTASAFRNYRHNPYNSNSITDGGVTATYEDASGGLWVGTGYGLNYFNPARDSITRFTRDDSQENTLSGNTILAITGQGDDLWLGVWSGGLNRLDQTTGEITHYLPEADNPRSIPGREPWDLIIDRAGSLWVATETGIARFNAQTDDFTRFNPTVEQTGDDTPIYTRTLFEDSRDNLWIGAIGGLYLLDRSSGEFRLFRHAEGTFGAPVNNFVKAIFEDTGGRLWIGMDSGLSLFDRDSETFTHYTTDEGLPDLVVTGLVEDPAGFLWISTQQGLARLNADTGQFRHFTEHHGLLGSLYNRDTALLTQRGELVFGNSKGLSIFDPTVLTGNHYVPPVYITGIQILNQPLTRVINAQGEAEAISFANTLVLQPGESVLELNYSALNYRQSQDNQYAYRLLGFSDNWSYVGGRRSAVYTNLDPGHYRFEVRASNNDGLWNPTPAVIDIKVLPPLWRTWWAYGVYVLLAFGLLYWFSHAQRIKYEYERDKLARERLLVKRLQEVDKLKDEFLANTSHELRTPLHGIIGLAESMMEGATGVLSQATKYNLAMIVSSGRRLSTLVDDILDFSKLRHRGLTLNLRAVDLYVVVDVVINLSRPLLARKPIVLINNVPADLPPVRADEDRLLQILHNLVGNAVKFTERGKIVVSACFNADTRIISLSVADTGIGIVPDQAECLFQAFEQGMGDTQRIASGTGLGLSVTRQLVELHGGRIDVEANADQGSVFTVTLPAAEEGAVVEAPLAVPASPVLAATPDRVMLPEGHRGSGPHILIVDDEPVNRQVLVNFLALKNYRISECDSGEAALKLIAEQGDVGLVLLDVMMPGLSGYEICKTLRRQYSSLALPVIFLTAKQQSTDLVQAFAVGANDFLAKPFSRDELLARVATHLQLLDIHRNLDQKVAERTDELRRINTGLEQAQQALKAAYGKLEQASLTDPLTGLYNRRYLYRHLDADIRRTITGYQKHLAGGGALGDSADMLFLLVDIDHFKEINDRYGHASGDKVLEDISRALSKTLRETDYLVRWGGEEFLLVARFCNRRDAAEMAERVRIAVDELNIGVSANQQIEVSCSVGAACFPFYPDAPEALGWEQVVDYADKALYASKNAGRNTWVSLIGKSVPRDLSADLSEAIKNGHVILTSNANSDVALGQ